MILPQLPQKIKLASKVVKVESKIIISLPKSLKLTVACTQLVYSLTKNTASEVLLKFTPWVEVLIFYVLVQDDAFVHAMARSFQQKGFVANSV